MNQKERMARINTLKKLLARNELEEATELFVSSVGAASVEIAEIMQYNKYFRDKELTELRTYLRTLSDAWHFD
jgi:hypothetical protein